MIDDTVKSGDITEARRALAKMHDKSTELDRLVDMLPRPAAHVAEEALRAAVRQRRLPRGLWRYRGSDQNLIRVALEWLRSRHRGS